MKTILRLNTGAAAKTRRTEKLLAHWRGKSNEWTILHGILCMGHAFHLTDFDDPIAQADDAAAAGMFDTIAIAGRLDALMGNTKERV